MEAQIIKLAHFSRMAFHNATSDLPIDQPIMSLIYGETPMVVGFKVNGVCRYIEDSKLAVGALKAIVDANTNNIASLAGQIGAVNGPFIFGSMMAPLGEAFRYVNNSGGYDIQNPLLGIEFELFEPFVEVQWVKLVTEKMYQGDEPGKFFIRYDAQEGWPLFTLFASQEDAGNYSNPLATAFFVASTPGVFQFIDANDNETVWGWLYTRYGVPQAPQPTVTFMTKRDNAFGIPFSRIVTGARIRVPFKFHVAQNGSESNVMTLSVRKAGVLGDYVTYGSFEFSLQYHSSDEQFAYGEVIIEIVDDNGGVIEAGQFQTRTWIELRRGDSEFYPLIDLQPQMQEYAVEYQTGPEVDTGMTFLSICQSALEYEYPITFDLLSAQAIYEPPAGNLQ